MKTTLGYLENDDEEAFKDLDKFDASNKQMKLHR